MSWSIGLIVNTVKVSTKVAKELFKAQAYDGEDEGDVWHSEDSVLDDEGHLYFDYDHMEHMDWLGVGDNLVDILKKNKVAGDVCFGSLEGDNDGSFWGYRFDGKGGMVQLEGKLVWTEEAPKKIKKGRKK